MKRSQILWQRIKFGLIGGITLSLSTSIIFAVLKHTFLIDPVSAIVGFCIGYMVYLAVEEADYYYCEDEEMEQKPEPKTATATKNYHRDMLEENKALKDALKFYASEEVWKLNGACDPNSGNFTGPNTASEALKKTSDDWA